ncbi:RDD family protein [Salinimicrobium sp. GXAS 041]|uniref:RDD family protein n=1 Tax=Salinimicrobium sp. GXAS 041 TaxID=3400806 RepID=UPI003C784E70
MAKDNYKGISFGKWVMGIVGRDENYKIHSPSHLKLFARNLPLIIWPVEFIAILFSKNKQRLGDKLGKTLVFQNPERPKKLLRVLPVIGLGVIFFILFFTFVSSALKSSEAYKLAISEIERNEEIIEYVGGIKDFGWMPTGEVSVQNGEGTATYDINVIGESKEMSVKVELVKPKNGEWEITSFHY